MPDTREQLAILGVDCALEETRGRVAVLLVCPTRFVLRSRRADDVAVVRVDHMPKATLDEIDTKLEQDFPDSLSWPRQ